MYDNRINFNDYYNQRSYSFNFDDDYINVVRGKDFYGNEEWVVEYETRNGRGRIRVTRETAMKVKNRKANYFHENCAY